MGAYDSHRWPEAEKRLTTETIVALTAALHEQRTSGRDAVGSLREAICSAAREARGRAIPPETFLVQLKLVADDAGFPPMLGDEATNAIREWMVNACITAYFQEQR
jgi:hypothetical protein